MTLVPSFSSGQALLVAAFLAPALALAQYSSPVRDVENPGHSPLRLTIFALVGPGGGNQLTIPSNVPAGKRMVIEYVSVSCDIHANLGVDVVSLDLVTADTTLNNGAFHYYALPVTKSATNIFGSNRYLASKAVNVYADGGTNFGNVGAQVYLSGPAPQAFGGVLCTFEVSGHTVNMP